MLRSFFLTLLSVVLVDAIWVFRISNLKLLTVIIDLDMLLVNLLLIDKGLFNRADDALFLGA